MFDSWRDMYRPVPGRPMVCRTPRRPNVTLEPRGPTLSDGPDFDRLIVRPGAILTRRQKRVCQPAIQGSYDYETSRGEERDDKIGTRRPVTEVGVPSVHRFGPYRFFFWAHENRQRREPPHIHVTSGDSHAIFWLSPVERRESRGYTDREIAVIKRLVVAHRTKLLKAWNDFFPE